MLLLSSGEFHDGAGPDIRNARVVIGTTTYAGEIEMHHDAAEWSRHGHDRDAAYNKVVLHVTFTASSRTPALTKSGRMVPLLVLQPFLTEPLDTLWNRYIHEHWSRTSGLIRCHGLNRTVPATIISQWLQKLDTERLELRMVHFLERLNMLVQEERHGVQEPWRRYGWSRREGFPEELPPPWEPAGRNDLTGRHLWEQVLYEGILEGLGYSHNRVPFTRLARAVPLNLIRRIVNEDDPLTLEGLLFGVAGLLPSVRSLREPASRAYVRSLARRWRLLKKNLRTDRVPKAEWQFFPTRPQNFPTLRIAAACDLVRNIFKKDLFRSIIQSLKIVPCDRSTLALLQGLFVADVDEYWKRHFHFDRPTTKAVTPLGTGRIKDIVANTVLPLSLLYARVFLDTSVRRGAMSIRELLPPLTDNAITRRMRDQLCSGKLSLNSLMLQQGAIELYKHYCTQGRCGECAVGVLVFRKGGSQDELVSI